MSAARAGLCSVLLAAASWATPAGFSGRALPAAVYGEDGRGDPDGVLDQGRLEAVESTVALFPAGSVRIDRGRGEAVLETAPYVSTDRGKPLCPDERFYGQPSGAFCTGFLVAPDAILTAGHCLRQFECSGMKVVFGFAAGKTGQQPGIVPDGEVYGCAEGLLGARGRGGDWALIRLDRAVRDHGVLRLNGSDDIREGTRVFLVGHPMGLPVKVAAEAAVTEVSEAKFRAHLDSYPGNSGSPVINAVTGLVEGVLSSGSADVPLDFEPAEGSEGCWRSAVRPDGYGSGPVATKMSAVLSSPAFRPAGAVRLPPGPLADWAAVQAAIR